MFEPGSYRDATSRVFYDAGDVYRVLNATAFADWQALAASEFGRRRMADGGLVPTEQVPPSEIPAKVDQSAWAAVLKHQTIPWVSYPYEWSFGMLRDAGLLTLELLDDALHENLSLKDGSAYNVQFVGAKPVFIDIPSFHRLSPGEPWIGYRQFCQLFLYPLFLRAYRNVPFQPWLRGNLDGIDPVACRNLMSLRDLFRPGVSTHVFLHARLDSRFADADRSLRAELPAAGFQKSLIQANVRGLIKILRKLEWRTAKTTWSDYAQCNSYTADDRARKEAFVRGVAQSRRWRRVWDLGCNTGVFSRIAAEHADYVVAMDGDPLAIERLYAALQAERNLKILPLIANVADPAPNQGWRGRERKSAAERGRPELTLCLALLHHLVIGANIPLREVLDWLADLTPGLIIEFVTKHDPMVQVLLRNKPDIYADYEQEPFERMLAERFEIVRRETLQSGTRTLYFAVAYT